MGILQVKNKAPEQTLRDIYAHWLKAKKVSALLVPAVSSLGVAAPVLISDPDKISQVSPFLPVMTVNGASIVAAIAAEDVPDTKVGAVLRPCELRAVVELIKLQQVSRENVFLIGMDCPGTYKLGQGSPSSTSASTLTFLSAQDGYLEDKNFRAACQMCEFPTPLFADLSIGFLGMNPEESLYVDAANEEGESLLEGVDMTPIEAVPDERRNYINRFIEVRQRVAADKIAEFDRIGLGAENLVRYFANCLNCHNCMKVCPVCYCRECFFESDVWERSLDEQIRMVSRKGLNRMPAGTLLFHLTRMNHMMTSCVQCGVCEDSCPAGIGLSVLFKKVSRNAQAEFGYLSGRSLDEPLPLTTFREDEFRHLGEE